MTTAQHGYVMVDPNDKGAWQKLELEVPIEENGYIYIYVANESMDNVDVYFDDMLARRNNCEGGEVQLIDAPVTSASDYYPFGLAMADRSYSSEKYRFGYQGQFAEMDEETGWNAFELRMYEPVIGRWMVLTILKSTGTNMGYRTDGTLGFNPHSGIYTLTGSLSDKNTTVTGGQSAEIGLMYILIKKGATFQLKSIPLIDNR
jgi:RHS repeat-associated protein